MHISHFPDLDDGWVSKVADLICSGPYEIDFGQIVALVRSVPSDAGPDDLQRHKHPAI